MSSSINQQHSYDFTRPSVHVVSRVYKVSPREAEGFNNQTLLVNGRGATTFAEIRRLNGLQYCSFRKTCNAYGFSTDNENWGESLHMRFGSVL